MDLERRGIRTLAGATAACLLMAVTAVTAVAAQASPSPGAVGTPMIGRYSGHAYGTKVTVGAVVRSSPTAPVTYGGCGTGPGIERTASVVSSSLPGLLKTGVITSTGSTSLTGSVATSATTNTITNVRVLPVGATAAITATAVESASTTTYNGSAFGVSAAGTTFTHLSVLGVPVNANVAPNTTIALPGIGSVVVNEQTASVGAHSATLTVNALDVTINAGTMAGTRIIVAHATSKLGFGQVTTSRLGGKAYGTTVRAGGLLDSSPTAPATIPCEGTHGNVQTRTVATVSLPGILTSGTVTDTAEGTVGTTTAGTTTSTVQGLNLLGGLLGVTAVTAAANGTSTAGSASFSDTGSSFVGLTVAGHPGITDDVAPNTRVRLAGLGTLYLHRVLRSAHSIEVRMIELKVGTNTLGLPPGIDIRIAVARVSIR